jgi:trehalose 6-phosphate phosphatase
MKPAGGYRRLWVFDFDGTLSPLVPDRSAAQLHPASRALLKDLAGDAVNRVAILSSRSIEDLASRVPIPNLFLGGGSGLEWRLPAGHRIRPGDEAEKKLEEARGPVLHSLKKVSSFPGVELEDKRWSVAVHFRRVPPGELSALAPLLQDLKNLPGVRVFEGPAVAEVLLLPSANKLFGIRKFCRFLRFDPSGGRIFYAGDDENDAEAMRWVISMRGTAIAVGNRVRITGVRSVDGPLDLARAVRAMPDFDRTRRSAAERRARA